MSGLNNPARRASASEVAAETSGQLYIAPADLRNHPYVPKVVLTYDQKTPVVLSSEGVTSVSDDGSGLFTITFDDDFAATGYAMVGCADITENSSADPVTVQVVSRAVGSIQVETVQAGGGGRQDCAYVSLAIWGDLA